MITLFVMAGLGQCNAAATYGRAAATYGHTTTYATAHHAASFVGFVAVDPYHSSTVGAAARVEAKAAADARVTADLTAQIASLNATLAGLAGAPPEPQAAAAVVAGAGAPAPYASVITTKCASCHNPAKQSGGLSFVDAKGSLLPLDAETKLAMLDSVAEKRMPKGKEAGSPEARRALSDWLKADSDAILAALKDNGK